MDFLNMDFLKIISEIFIIPVFGMVWSIQGRISRMEGELKSLYSIINLIVKRRRDDAD